MTPWTNCPRKSASRQPVITNYGVHRRRASIGASPQRRIFATRLRNFSSNDPGRSIWFVNARPARPGHCLLLPLGTFTHRNFTVTDPSLTSVQLDVVLVLNVDGVQTGPLNFTFTFNHVETPNNPTPPATCPYPTPAGEGCTDRVTFCLRTQPTTFNVGGVDYTLSMSFVDNNGNPVAEFITKRRPLIKHREPGRTIYVATDDDRRAGAHGHEVGPGDDESGTVGQFRHRRPEHRIRRRLERHPSVTCSRTARRAACAI